MPLYEFRCRVCGKVFELLRRMQDDDRELECPECRSQEVDRQISSFATGGAGGCGPSGSGRFT